MVMMILLLNYCHPLSNELKDFSLDDDVSRSNLVAVRSDKAVYS